MTRATVLTHEFVDYIPDDLAVGMIYVSIPYATASHRCCCGCGNEVITPLSPTDWQLTFDGESISLTPSIGNWSFDCQSHYWLRRNRVKWARRWSRQEIENGRARDRLAMEQQFDSTSRAVDLSKASSERPNGIEFPWSLLRRLSRRRPK